MQEQFLSSQGVHAGMDVPGCYEHYPVKTVIAANLVSLLVYGIGAYILSGFGIIWVTGYLLFILVLEFRLLGGHCPDCYYYGKTCAFGKGALSARLFPKGRPERFAEMKITWKSILPDVLVFILPVVAGILILLREFSAPVFILVVALLLLGFFGNALVRGRLACRYCRQRETGCPAEQLFSKSKK